MTATVRIIGLDGATTAKSTSITDPQAPQVISLVEAIKTAREILRPTEGQQNVTGLSGTLDEIHPLTVRQLLPRLDEILGKRYSPANMDVLANKNNPALGYTGQPTNPSAESLRSSISASGDYIGVARTLGLLLTNENQPYDRLELIGGPTTCQLSWR
jgi:hypothetical protein